MHVYAFLRRQDTSYQDSWRNYGVAQHKHVSGERLTGSRLYSQANFASQEH